MTRRSLSLLAVLLTAAPAVHAQSADALAAVLRHADPPDEFRLRGSGSGTGDDFGFAVALRGDVALVGAPGVDGGGAAYIFTFDGTAWTQRAQLGGNDSGGRFGSAVALGDGVAVVGDPSEGQTGQWDRGAAYVYAFDGAEWDFRFKLQDAQPASAPEAFGSAVAIDGSLVIVGDPLDGGYRYDSHYGAAYLFNAETGAQVRRLVPSRIAQGFGRSVALGGGRALVGAYHHMNHDLTGGAFAFGGGGWTEQAAFLGSGEFREFFGYAVGLSDAFAFVGQADNRGVAVFDVATWTEQTVLRHDGPDDSVFGLVLAVDGPRLLVGDNGANDGRGSAQLFAYDGEEWRWDGQYTASDGEANDWFGYAVALSGPRALVGAHHDDLIGSAYVLSRPEGRLAVTVTGDEPNHPASQDEGVCDVDRAEEGDQCTLRAAIELANAAEDDEEEVGIAFDIEGAGPHVIELTSPLPALERRMKLDGATEPDFVQGTATEPPVPSVHVVGSASVARGLVLAGDSTTVIGLAFGGFAEAAIDVPPGPGRHRVSACWIGLDAAGTAARPNGVGVRVNGAPGVVVGGNVIGGNTEAGVRVVGEDAAGVRVVGNWLGVTADGEAALPNAIGVDALGAVEPVVEWNTILATTAGVRLSGSDAPTTGARIEANRLGLLPTNALPPAGPPGGYGVLVENAAGTRVGGASDVPGMAPGNVIGGWNAGVFVVGTAAGHPVDTRVVGNLIGLDSTGTQARPNGVGVWVHGGAEDTRVGGWEVGERNVISGGVSPTGNGSGVVVTTGDGTEGIGEPTGTVVAGNYIGTDVTGTDDVGHERWGVYVGPFPGTTTGGPTDVVVGATATMAGGAPAERRRNVIAHSGETNVLIDRQGLPPAGAVRVVGNWIGLDAAGEGTVTQGTFGGATRVGVHVRGQARAVVGGAGEDGNVIGGHRIGVWVDADEGVVVGNRIGTDPAGVERRANSHGVAVSGSRVRVGLTADGTPVPNVISGNILAGESNGGNDGVGVYVASRDHVEPIVEASGRGAAGALAFDDATGAPSARAVATGAAASGGSGAVPAADNVVAHNLIGTTAAGDAPVVPTEEVNRTAAVWVTSGAVGTRVYANTIGGTWAGMVIAPPADLDVVAYPTGTLVAGNRIGLAAAGGDEDFVPNRVYGIGVSGAVGTVVGDGAVEGQGPNRIAGSGAEGSGLPPDNWGAPGVALRHPEDAPEGWPVGGTTLRRNLIYGNQGLAITWDADAYGPTPNDEDNHDGVASFNFPRVLQAVDEGPTLAVVGTSSVPMAVEVYADRPCDESGYGEGRLYLGTVQAADGVFQGSVGAVPGRDWRVSVTGTNLNGTTSEFSPCQAVVAPGEALAVPVAEGGTPNVDGPDLTVDVTSNAGRAAGADARPGGPAGRAAGTLYLALHRTAPDAGALAGSATGADGTTVTPDAVHQQRFWTVQADGLDGIVYEACLRYDGLSGLPVPGQLLVLSRPGRGAAWTPHDATLRSEAGAAFVCAAGLTGYGELALGTEAAEAYAAATLDGRPGWRMLSAPLGGLTVGGLAERNLVQGVPGLYPDAATNLHAGYSGTGWVTPAGSTDELLPGRGLLWYLYDEAFDPGGPSVSRALPMALALGGDAPPAEVALPLHAAGEGWNLLGNPFPFDLDLSAMASWAEGGALASAVGQVWDPNAGSTGSYVPTSVMGDELPVWSGMFVQNADADLLRVPASAVADRGGEEAEEPSRLVAFELAGQAPDGAPLLDRALVAVFREAAGDGWDAYDAGKLTPLGAAYVLAAFAGERAGEPVAKAQSSHAAAPGGAVELPISVETAGATGALVLSWPRVEVPEGWRLTLRDVVTGAAVDLREATGYAFELASAAREGARPEARPLPPSPALRGGGLPRLVLRMEPSGVVATEPDAPAAFALGGVRPNPARGSAAVEVALPEAADVRVAVYDALGREVAVLADGERPAGRHALRVDVGRLAAGVYVVRMTAGDFVGVRRLTVVR